MQLIGVLDSLRIKSMRNPSQPITETRQMSAAVSARIGDGLGPVGAPAALL